MNILVTGHNGFIGRNMMAWLNAEGWTVDGYEWDMNERPDVSTYDWVIHLGAIADMRTNNVEQIMVQNYDFSCWLFEECQRHQVNLQYASSSSVYGDSKDFSETANCNPQTPYAWSKYLFDRWAFKQPNHTAFVQGFRYFNVYGKYMHLREVAIIVPMLDRASARCAAVTAAAVAVMAYGMPFRLNILLAIVAAIIVGMKTDRSPKGLVP